MFAVCRATERLIFRQHDRETWSTFGPEDGAGAHVSGYGALESLTETLFAPGAGSTARPPPRDTEILTYLLSGALAQEDSTGRSGVLSAGEFQHLTTGRLVHYSERNASQTAPARAFRLSLRPSIAGREHAREQKLFSVANRRGALCIVASSDGRRGSLLLHHDGQVYSAILDVGVHVVHVLAAGRVAWLHVVSGEAIVEDLVLTAGDGVGITDELLVSFTAREETEVLLIDLAATPPSPRTGDLP